MANQEPIKWSEKKNPISRSFENAKIRRRLRRSTGKASNKQIGLVLLVAAISMASVGGMAVMAVGQDIPAFISIIYFVLAAITGVLGVIFTIRGKDDTAWAYPLDEPPAEMTVTEVVEEEPTEEIDAE